MITELKGFDIKEIEKLKNSIQHLKNFGLYDFYSFLSIKEKELYDKLKAVVEVLKW